MAAPMRKAHFIEGWMDMGPNIPVPIIDWIEDKKLDIAYGDDALQKFDLYYPNNPAKSKLPLVVIVHGGGFSHMDKRDWHLYPGFFALERGFAVASINYRLAPKDKFPAAIDDTIASLEHLRDHADEWNLDMQNVFMIGTSAGGNLAPIAGMKGIDGIRFGTIAAYCPATSFPYFWGEVEGSSIFSYQNIVKKILMPKMMRDYLGTTPPKDPQLALRASVEDYIHPGIPPFYILQGDKDPLISIKGIEIFRDQLKEIGKLSDADLAMQVLPGAGHAGGGPDYFEKANLEPTLDFFEAHIIGV